MAEGEDERGVIKGIVNPAFQEKMEGESEMRGGMHNSTLAALRQNVELQAAARIRENEGAQNYFDPSLAVEGDPRRCRMSGFRGRDELELKFMNEDKKNLYKKLSEMLQEEDTSSLIDLPGMVHEAEKVEPSAEGVRKDLEGKMSVLPHYLQHLRKCVQKDMMPVGRPALEQEEHLKQGMTEEKVWVRKQRVTSFLRKNSKVDGTRSPQPIEVRIMFLRAVRDKLPRGLYSLNVSLKTELGGPTLQWSRLQEQQWTGSTEPVEHRGQYLDTELNINQSLSMVLPASCDLLPSSVLLFRLSSLPNNHSHVNYVVSWGVFPICDCSLKLLNGTFMTPLLRGGPDPSLKLFGKIEHLLSTDLDNWLCNLYFQVKRFPRGSTGLPGHSSQPQQSSNQGLPLHQDTSTRSSASLLGKSATGPRDKTLSPDTDKDKAGINSKIGRQKKMIFRNSGLLKALTEDELDQFSFSVQSQQPSQCRSVTVCGTVERMRLALSLLPSLLDLSWHPQMSQITLNLLLFSITWFPRLYLHYCSQWLYLQGKHIPVNRFGFRAHTVDLVYQGTLMSTLEELVLVLLGPLTLSGALLLLLLIRWACQLVFGSPPSFLSKFIMAAAMWTVLDPLAVFAVDAVLGRLSYSPDNPLADAAKLYWHFYRTEQSGTAGIIITLFLYAVHFVLSFTILYIYLLRLHKDGRLLDIYHRLHSSEGEFFIPHDMEVSNQELSYIVKKAEQWRGFNGERRKVAVYDYIWIEKEPGSTPPAGTPITGCETSTHLFIYTLHLSGLRQHYRHFLRQPDGSIIEVMENCDSTAQLQRSEMYEQHEKMKSVTHPRERQRRRAIWRSHRVEPLDVTETPGFAPNPRSQSPEF